MRRKALAYILAAAMALTGMVQTDTTALAGNVSDVTTEDGKGVGLQDDAVEVETSYKTSGKRNNLESYADRAVTGIDLAGDTGANTMISATDADGNQYTSGVYLSWRSYEADFDANRNLKTTFTVYKNNQVIAKDIKVTNLIDPSGSAKDSYKVVGSSDAALGLKVRVVKPWAKQYLELSLYAPADETMPDGSTCDYSANDMSVGDVDGDGILELIVKWYPSNAKDNSNGGYTGETIIDTYKIDASKGTAKLLTRINLGLNIRSGAHYTQFQVWDFDGDGKAEMAVKTSDGSTTYKSADGTDKTLTEVTHVGAVNVDALPTDKQQSEAQYDYRNSSGYVLTGNEYFSVFNLDDGTKAAEDVTYTPERGSVDAWGDAYGNRVDRFLSGVAYLDGENPYAVFCRGYYTRIVLAAYYLKDTNGDGIGDTIDLHWVFDTNNYDANLKKIYEAQGNHAVSVNDVDGDGKDEIIYGGLVVDHDGTVLYSTGLGHGDALHVSDWVPWNDGLEIMCVHEHDDAAYHVEVHDAATGKILMGYYVGKDTGRGVAGDIDPTQLGGEWWSIVGINTKPSDEPSWNSSVGSVYSAESTLENLIELASCNPPANFTIFWDGDLLTELQDHNFDEVPYVPVGANILKWDYQNNKTDELLYSEEIWSNNGTKGNLGLVADIMGDWREEIIVRTTDAKDEDGAYVDANNKIRIYMTTIQTDYVVPCLLENLAYREGIAWQNVGYNQPANLDYLLSEDVVTAQLTAIEGDGKEVKLEYTAANDGKYGHEIVAYHLYRADVDADGKIGEYKLLDTIDMRIYPDQNDSAHTYVYRDATVEYNKTYSYRMASVVEAEGVVAGVDAGAVVTRDSYWSKSVEVDVAVNIASSFVPSITLDDIVQDTPCDSVADLLPKTVTVSDADQKNQQANVTWDVSGVDIKTPGAYTVTAKIQGYAETVTASLNVVANALESQNVTEIHVVQNEENVSAYLPAKMTLTFKNGVKAEEAITWDKTSVSGVSTGEIGKEYKVTGTWKDDAVNVSDKTVTVIMKIVGDYIETMDDIYAEIDLGTTDVDAALPKTVSATYKSGEKKNVDIVWGSLTQIDASKIGDYEAEFTSEGYNGTKTAHVSVLYPAIYKFDFGIDSKLEEDGWIGITLNKKGGSKKVSELGYAYSDEQGYGFQNPDAVVQGRTENGYTQAGRYSNNVYGDFALMDGQTFSAKVDNGRYQVEIMYGSSGNKGTVSGNLEGTVAVSVGSGAGSYTVGVYEVDVQDGRLDFTCTGNTCRMPMMVIRRIAAMEISDSNLQMLKEDTHQLSVTNFKDEANPALTKNDVVWTSSNVKVATVDTKGVVTAHSEGRARIRATIGGVTFTCIVDVALTTKQTLEQAISNAAEYGGDENAAKYTAESYKAYTDALAKVNELNGNAAADASEVEAAVAALNQAIANLELSSVYQLNTAIADAEGYEDDANASIYTAESYQEFKDALEAVRKLSGQTSVDAAEAAAAMERLERAIENLTLYYNDGPKAGDKIDAVGDAKSVYTYKKDGTVEFTSTSNMKAIIPNTIQDKNNNSYKVTSIAAKAFQSNKKITQVTIGDNITAIATNQFAGMTKLSKVTIGTGVKTIGKNAFKGDKKLTTVTFKKTSKVATIKASAFQSCEGLKNITLPDSVKVIDTAAFSGCKALQTVKIGTSSKSALSTIRKNAFKNCKKIQTVTIKSTKLKTVQKTAFSGVKSTAKIKAPKSKVTAYTKLFKKAGCKAKVTK